MVPLTLKDIPAVALWSQTSNCFNANKRRWCQMLMFFTERHFIERQENRADKERQRYSDCAIDRCLFIKNKQKTYNNSDIVQFDFLISVHVLMTHQNPLTNVLYLWIVIHLHSQWISHDIEFLKMLVMRILSIYVFIVSDLKENVFRSWNNTFLFLIDLSKPTFCIIYHTENNQLDPLFFANLLKAFSY